MAKEQPVKKGRDSAINEWLTELKTPISAGLSTGDLQTQYNQMRNQIQGTWGAGAETLKGQLGERGFRAGESGLADTALGGLYEQGSQALSKGATDVYLDEAKRSQDLANMNLQRLTSGGSLAAELEKIRAQRAATGSAAGGAAARLAWEKEKFGKQFPWEQEMQATGQLFDLMGMMGGSQQQVYAPYYEALGQGTAGY